MERQPWRFSHLTLHPFPVEEDAPLAHISELWHGAVFRSRVQVCPARRFFFDIGGVLK